jgi:hypothetical protein
MPILCFLIHDDIITAKNILARAIDRPIITARITTDAANSAANRQGEKTMARKYQFKGRAEAEQAYREADRARLRAEWLATAILGQTAKRVGLCKDGATTISVGYVALTHSVLVFALTDGESIHRIRGIWDADDEQICNVIAGLMRYEDTHEFGRLLDAARYSGLRELSAA